MLKITMMMKSAGSGSPRTLMSALCHSPNKPLQRSGLDKVPGRGRGDVVLEQFLRARVLRPQWPAAERSRSAS